MKPSSGVMGVQVQPGQLAGMRPFRYAVRGKIQGPGLGGGIYLFGHPQGPFSSSVFLPLVRASRAFA